LADSQIVKLRTWDMCKFYGSHLTCFAYLDTHSVC